ncbi:MAG: hypothetical protein V1772_13395 [Chloroflexota bacterium]
MTAQERPARRPARWAPPLALVGVVLLLVGVYLLISPLPVAPRATKPTDAARPGGAAMPAAMRSPTQLNPPSLTERLRTHTLPLRDDRLLVAELRGRPAALLAPPRPLADVGDSERFWIGDLDVPTYYGITATLRLATEHVAMWVADDVELDLQELARSAQAFEERIAPTNRAHFGPEPNPGIDGDPRVAVLNASFTGAAGFFSAANNLPSWANPLSNERDLLTVNVAALMPGTAAYESVLAHEFQHMIHWHYDGNEDAWVNEGASELAEELNGYGWPQGNVQAVALDPDLQLTAWSDGPGAVGRHYGASYLFLRYLYDRYGGEAVRAVIAEPANGARGVEAALASLGHDVAFDDLFADWLVANALDAPDADPRYGYLTADLRAAPVITLTQVPARYDGDVRQYAADYVALAITDAPGLRLAFQGAPTVRLVEAEAPSERHLWWSGRGENSHSWLEHAFDLRGLPAATLELDLWYDIEAGWDVAYVRASADDGRTWALLRGEHMVERPTGDALGWGYTDRSGVAAESADPPRWVRESLDLTPYAGQVVRVRWDYVTDDAINRQGLCLDNVRVAAIGFADDVEAGEGAWRSAGFLRHDNTLAQGWIVQLVTWEGGQPRVQRLAVGADGQGAWDLPPEAGSHALLIIGAVAPVTTVPAPYRLRLEQRP